MVILRPEKSDNRRNSVVSLLRCTFLMSQRLRMKVSPPPREVTGLVREQPWSSRMIFGKKVDPEGGNGTTHQEPSGCWENSQAGGNNF